MLRARGDAFVVDPGGDEAAVVDAVDGARVRAIVLTHGHYDHCGAAAPLVERWGVACAVHRADRDLLERAPHYAVAFDRRALALPREVVTFGDDGWFEVGGVILRALASPGHTPGSVCLVGDGLALTGDTLLRNTVGRTDLPGGDPTALRSTVARLLDALPADARLLPGHGDEWTVPQARAWWDGAGS